MSKKNVSRPGYKTGSAQARPVKPSAKSRRQPAAKATTIAFNRQAARAIETVHTFEAGMILSGSEVKSCRAGRVQLREAFIKIRNGEIFVVQMHISEYAQAGVFGHKPTDDRKLLLHKHEIRKLLQALQRDHFTAVPARMLLRGGYLKLEIIVGRGRTDVDKRQLVKKRDEQRDLQRVMRSAQRNR